ncbi:metallophosphoesterase [Actinomycetaceae bacterium MB13-C1-2]|nr:metallophosphoesterase [Actinomycetaceae bacterium MB13-C1-2]
MNKHLKHKAPLRSLLSTLSASAILLVGVTSPVPAFAEKPTAPTDVKVTRVEEGFSDAQGQVPPEGWTVESSESASGMQANWQGWSFHSLSEITAKWGTGGEHSRFSLADGTVAIVQSDGNRPSNSDFSVKFSSTLWSPNIELDEHLGAVKVSFDSHYRQGQAPQTATLVASFDNSDPIDVMKFDAARYNETVEVIVDAPENASQVKFGWAYLNSSNNWYWMIDNVAIMESEPAPANPYFVSDAKPIATPGSSLAVTVAGLREGMTPVLTLDDMAVANVPTADAEGTLEMDVTIPKSVEPGFMTLTVSGKGIAPISQTITVFSDTPAPYESVEPRLWVSTLDDLTGWDTSGDLGWETMNADQVVSAYGTDNRQSFTRADGAYVHIEAGSGGEATLRSPAISISPSQQVELRLDTHLRVRGNSSQSASINAIFDSGRQELLWTGTENLYSAQLRLPLRSKAGESSVRFEISYESGAGEGSLSVDNVYLARPLAELPEGQEPEAVVDVLSDVQGALTQMCDKVLPGFQELSPKSDVLVVNGDLVNQGTDTNWNNYITALNGCGRDNYNLNISTIGNHEFYPGGSTTVEQYRQRFLDYTDMEDVGGQGGLWGEVLVDDELPLLWIGTEGYDYNRYTGSGPFFVMSDEQFDWLRGRLDYYRQEERPVLLFSHFVFPYSVSGTYIRFNANDYGEDTARVASLLQENPNVVMINSHTHWDINLNDWTAEKRFTPSADYGVNTFNTGAVTTQYGPSGDWGEKGISGADPTGLRVSLYPDRVRVTAYHFTAGGPVAAQEYDVPRPGQVEEPVSSVEVETSVTSRCVAGKVTQVISARNIGENPVDISITSPHGTKNFKDIAPDRSSSVALSTRAKEIDAGTVSFTATDTEGNTTNTQVDYPSTSCK